MPPALRVALATVVLSAITTAHAVAADPPSIHWPLWIMHTPPVGAEAALGAGETLFQMDVDPRGGYLVFGVRAAAGTTGALRLWDFKTAPAPLRAAELDGRSVESLAFSPFDASLFVASRDGAGTRIDRFTIEPDGRAMRKVATVFTSPHRIERLVTGLVAYDQCERLYFGLETIHGRFQIMSVRGDGTGAYEVTSPGGTATALTDAAFRARQAGAEEEPPKVVRATSAVPLSLAPDGTLIWRAPAGALMEQTYAVNWGQATAIPGGSADVDEVAPANGYFRERWTKGRPGFELLNRKHGRTERVAGDVTFASRPVVAFSGRAFIGELSDGTTSKLRTFALPSRAAAVRVHPGALPTKEAMQLLERDGILLTPTEDKQIYDRYDRLAYLDLGCGEHGGIYNSVFASIDGFFEVLNAGFEAVFMVAEQKVSRPALAAVIKELARVGAAQGNKRLTAIASTAAAVLTGNLEGPEGALIRAGQSAPSTLPINVDGQPIGYGDFVPRGPYAVSKPLSNYFRAFKLMSSLQLARAEQRALAGDAAFMAALRRWVDVQRPFLAGTRHPTLFDVGVRATDVPSECIPARFRATAPLLFPLAWSMDSEILEGSVARDGVGPSCGAVPGRSLPTGLDLLAGLGSPKASALQAAEYEAYPALATSRDAATHRAAVLAKATTFIDSYLRLMQLLATDTKTPEAVTADRWQRRLLQSALGTWVGLRHTLVLVSERGSAECGGEAHQFELLQEEPARGAVDPLPEAWNQVGALLELLAKHARAQAVSKGLAAQLHEQAGVARAFGRMADEQMRQVPLTATEYEMIEGFGGAVEHPYLLFKSALSRVAQGGDEGNIPVPEPMTKIVDIQRGPGGEVWHAAVGHPWEALVLLGDRGVLVPATGSVYSFYEVTAEAPLTDKAWRERMPTAQPPAWVRPLLHDGPDWQAEKDHHHHQ
ncbi:MAG TPA: DUF3160 domain-containing protein [Polyangia bacterium]|jgi:hypothetical protein